MAYASVKQEIGLNEEIPGINLTQIKVESSNEKDEELYFGCRESSPCVDRSLVKMERKHGISYYRFKDDFKQEVRYPSAGYERHAECNSPLRQPNKIENMKSITSFHFTNNKIEKPKSKSAENHAKTGKYKNIANSEHNCSYCSKSFKSRWTLETHVKTHTIGKSFECNECRKRFSLQYNLRVHMRIHTGERPYSCKLCTKSFTHRYSLIVHVRTHTGDRPYKCTECPKAFTQRITFIRHMRIHTGDKPYKCSECLKAFTQKSSFIRHIRIHTGDRPYKCSECLKAFIQKTDFIRHMRIHSSNVRNLKVYV